MNSIGQQKKIADIKKFIETVDIVYDKLGQLMTT